MKQIAIIIVLLALGIFLGAGSVAATYISETGPEVSLIGSDGIFNEIYGLENLNRINDGFDHIWNPANGNAKAMAKYAGFSQDFGYIPDLSKDTAFDESFVYLFTVTGDGLDLGAPTAALSSGEVSFLWALNPSGALPWTSLQSQTSDTRDQMVTWLITGEVGNTTGNFVIAWEDIPGGGDQDLNDLVVEVSSSLVFEPSAMFLLGTGFIGIAVLGRKRFLKI